MLELVALASDGAAAAEIATQLGGISYQYHGEPDDRRPYAGMVRVATDRIEPLAEIANVGLYTAFARTIKAPSGSASPDRVIGSFGLVHHPDLTRAETDRHWRDVHGPLALRSHSAMCDYTQVSIVAVHRGLAIDGIALCAFDSRDDLHNRFFDDDEARAAIQADVASFADIRSSPRRVILTQDEQAAAT